MASTMNGWTPMLSAMASPTPLAQRIQEILDAKGMKQIALARLIGRTRSTISQYLTGKIPRMTPETAQAIEEKTGYGATWIATGKGIKLPKQALTLASSQELPLDLSILRKSVELVHQAIDAAKVRLGPEEHAKLLEIVYSLYQNGSIVEPGTVRAMLHLVKNAKK